MMKRTMLFLVLFCLCSVGCYAGQPAMGPGAFGFDWLNPENARCALITPSLRAQFKDCRYQADGAFGLADPLFSCPVSDKSVFLVFENESACKRNLETMQANAP